MINRFHLFIRSLSFNLFDDPFDSMNRNDFLKCHDQKSKEPRCPIAK